MQPPQPLALTPAECVPGRPFADPEQTARDFAVLESMRARLRAELAALAQEPPAGTLLLPPEPDGLPHRVILLSRAGLLSGAPLAVVGFFGQRRPDADDDDLAGIDDELIEELRSHPFMLSYSSRLLPSGSWANLVLLADPQGARRWRESARHAYAASQIAPRYYATIRIHNGALPEGLGGPAIAHARTMYYDFREGDWWLAVRASIPADLDARSRSD
jgi:hypothetical protein